MPRIGLEPTADSLLVRETRRKRLVNGTTTMNLAVLPGPWLPLARRILLMAAGFQELAACRQKVCVPRRLSPTGS